MSREHPNLPDAPEGSIRELDTLSAQPHTARFDINHDQYKEQRIEKFVYAPTDSMDLPSVIDLLKNSWDTFQLFFEEGGMSSKKILYFPFLFTAKPGWKFYNHSKQEDVTVVEVLATGVSQMYHGTCGVMLEVDKIIQPTDLILAKDVGPEWTDIDHESWDQFREGYSKLEETENFTRTIRLVELGDRPARLRTTDGDIVNKPRHVNYTQSGNKVHTLKHYPIEHELGVFLLSRSAEDVDIMGAIFRAYSYNLLSQASAFGVTWRWKKDITKDVFGTARESGGTSAEKRVQVLQSVYEIKTFEMNFNLAVRPNVIALIGEIDDGDRGSLIVGE